MAFLDQYITQYHRDVKPYILAAARRADGYGAAVCDILNGLRRDMAVDRDPGEVMATPLLLPADGSAVNVFLVPSGEEYVLELLRSDTPAAVFMRLTADGSFRTMTSNASKTEPVRFVGPCQIGASLAAAGTITPAYVQLRRLARLARPTHSGGMVETGLDPVDALRTHAVLHEGVGIG